MKFFKYALFLAALGVAGFFAADYVISKPSDSAAGASLPRMAEKTHIEVEEDCPFGRCPCMRHRIQQTSVPAGWSKLKKTKFSADRCDPPPSGHRVDIYRRQKCVICPEGMQYSGFLRDSAKIRSRANLTEDQCVLIKRTCLDDKRK